MARFDSPGSGAGQFGNPKAIALDGDGTLSVADRPNHRIPEFVSANGTTRLNAQSAHRCDAAGHHRGRRRRRRREGSSPAR